MAKIFTNGIIAVIVATNKVEAIAKMKNVNRTVKIKNGSNITVREIETLKSILSRYPRLFYLLLTFLTS